ncbi:tenascin-r [Plakobranchus ocellatus]|uniref:Tenascin-r n=1 Tax=Plakobranchus ocellatus TaxID=259542 RepID=A0AAV4C3X6_9GAST|nr:tenascin-r [Plakobranchus ocellatus]
MGNFIIILALVHLLSVSQGLKLTLDLNGPDSDSVCGVVSCLESYQSSDASLNGNEIYHNSEDRTISIMTIFKTTMFTSLSDEIIKHRSTMASLTLQQPKISRVSDGVKIDGHLKSGGATLRLELKKKEDCISGFICEVRSSDKQGNEFVSSNHLRQQSMGQTYHSQAGSAIPLQLLTFMQTLLSSSLSDKLGSLENRLEDKIELLKGDIERRIESQLDVKFSAIQKAVDVYENAFAGLKKKLDIIPKEVEKGYAKALRNTVVLLSRMEDKIDDTTTTLSSLKGLAQLDSQRQKDKVYFDNVTDIFIKKIANTCSSKDLSERVSNEFSVLNDSLHDAFIQQQLNNYHCSMEGFSSIQDELKKSHEVLINQIQSVADFLRPRFCRKGMPYVLTKTPFPYPVIYPNEESGLPVPFLCDTITDGGGWIIIQRRSTGEIDFFRNWNSYKKGFGSLDNDFWLGNENIHTLTSNDTYELRVDLRYENRTVYAHYDMFSIDDEENKFTLRLGKYHGTAGDSLLFSNGYKFSTYDQDNDVDSRNCAVSYRGAWWYRSCHRSNLNGKWQALSYKGPSWNDLTSGDPVTFSEMKIRAMTDL